MAERDGVYHVTGDEVAEMLAEIRERAHPTPPMHPIRADLTRAVSLIAERVASVADRRATGTELAAMRLALGVLRRSAWKRGTIAHAHASGALHGAAEAINLARMGTLRRSITDWPWTSGMARLLRARLALYLRARLRMERGDTGPRVGECEACDGWGEVWHHGSWPPHELACTACDGCGLRGTITPLWQLAPAHEVRS